MGGAHTAAGMGLPRRKRFLTTAHGSVPEAAAEAAATREAADARTAAIAARRAMAGGWKKRQMGKRETEDGKEREGEGDGRRQNERQNKTQDTKRARKRRVDEIYMK